MEKAKFLKQLRKALRNEFSTDEIKDVIQDYNEYFDTGLSEGKSEHELCEEFGEPACIASELLNEKESENKRKGESYIKQKSTIKVFIIRIFFAILLLLCLLYIAAYNSNYPVSLKTYNDLWLTLLFPISLLGFINIIKIYKGSKVIKIPKIAYLLSLIPIGIQLILISFCILPEVLKTQLSYNNVGAFMSIGIYFIYGIIVSFTYLFILISISKKSFNIFFIFFFVGLFIVILNIHSMLRNFTDTSNFQQDLIRCFYPIPFAILLTIAAFLLKNILFRPMKVGA